MKLFFYFKLHISFLLHAAEPTEAAVFRITNALLDVYCSRRVRVFYSNVRTKSALLSNELRRLHGGPSDTIGKLHFLFKNFKKMELFISLQVHFEHPPLKIYDCLV